MIKALLIAFRLIQLTGPEGQVIILDTEKITTLREPREGQLAAPATKCHVFTVDGKNINVIEPCTQIRKMLEESSK